MSCEICNGKGTVVIEHDCIEREWPCPKCRVRRYISEQPWDDHDVLNWQSDSISFEKHMRAKLKERIAKNLVSSIVEIDHFINGTFHLLTAEMRVVIPNGKEKNDVCHWHQCSNGYFQTGCGLRINEELLSKMFPYLLTNFCGHCVKRSKKIYING